MDLPHAAVLFLSLAIFLRPPTAASFNITAILEKDGRFPSFNQELSRTNLATKINKGQTITVCVVADSVMADLKSKNLDLAKMTNVLSLHVLVDYFDATKLHDIDGSAEVSTMFQATGSATGSSGIVNITNAHGGKVNFTTQDGNGVVVGNATFVKDIHQEPYNISVIQISAILNSPVALAPSPPPPPPANLTANMSAHGCKVFAEILANSSAQRTFDDNTESGLTVFCPGDDVMTKFLPQFRNLSEGGKLSLLEYHGIPIYQTMAELRSTNNLVRTLASSGKGSYEFRLQNNGTDVLIQTKVVTAHIGKSVFDSQNQVAIFQVDKVLMPAELFNSTLAPSASPVPAPAPAPGPGASSPKPSSHDSPPSPPAPPADNPADSPADEPTADDQTGHRNGAAKFYGGGVGAVILSLWFVFLQL